MMADDGKVSVLTRTDISMRIAHVIGVFSSERSALEALSLDVLDHSSRFADAFLNSGDPLNVSLSDGIHSLYIWSVVTRDIDQPVFFASSGDFCSDGAAKEPLF